MKKIILIFIAFSTLSGCGTIVKLVDPTESYSAYTGATYDLEMAQEWGLPILDLPLSFLLDTVLLPYTLTK